MWFDEETVTNRIRYDFPWRHIIHDIDGTTTDQGPGSWATAYYKHLEQPGCLFDEATQAKYGGIVCDSRNQIRKLAFSGMNKSHVFRNQGLRVLRYDDDFMAMQDREEYIADFDNYSDMPFQ